MNKMQKKFEAYTDASRYSLVGCLTQDYVVNRLEGKGGIAYVSKAFNKT